jgi:hypothetical protein
MRSARDLHVVELDHRLDIGESNRLPSVFG